MSATLVDVIALVLIPMGLLPVITAAVLWPHRHSSSMALKERARLSLVLAVLGVVVAVIAVNRLLDLGWQGAWIAIPLGLALLLADGASGVWLWQFWKSRFR